MFFTLLNFNILKLCLVCRRGATISSSICMQFSFSAYILLYGSRTKMLQISIRNVLGIYFLKFQFLLLSKENEGSKKEKKILMCSKMLDALQWQYIFFYLLSIVICIVYRLEAGNINKQYLNIKTTNIRQHHKQEWKDF